MADTKPTTSKKTKQAKQVSKEVISRPRFHQKLTINSLQAQRVMNRSFSRIANAFFSVDVILQIIGEQDEIDQVNSVIDNYIEQFESDLEKALEQIKGLMKTNGITEVPSYSAPHEYSIEITSPSIAQFTKLIRQFDELMVLVDTVWLNGVLSSHQRSTATYEWQQRLFKMSARIIGVEKRARIAAKNKGKDAEVAEQAPEQAIDDPEIDAESNKDDVENKPKAETA